MKTAPQKPFFLAAAGVAAIWIAWTALSFILKNLGFEVEYGTLGQWGDSFGALNALFGALACIAVVATFWMQRQELNNQQEQIDKNQRQQHIQQFESSFFQLLGLLRDLRKEIRYTTGQDTVTGPEALKGFHDAFLKAIGIQTFYDKKLTVEEVAAVYDKVTRTERENELGPYFRIIYTILRRISEDQLLSMDERHKYGNIVRSQLSTPEINLVGLNGLSSVSKDFKKFIVEFRLLKYVPDERQRLFFQNFYPHETLEDRDTPRTD